MKIKSLALASLLALNLNIPVNAGGVPTFDGVNTGLNMRELMQTLMQTHKQLEQYALQGLEFKQQVDQYANQFGDITNLLRELRNLSFIQTADGFIPADWQEAIAVLQGISENVPAEVKTEVDKVLQQFSDIDIADELLKQPIVKQSKELSADLTQYLTQMKVAQDRLKSSQQLSQELAKAESQKDREAITAQINIESLKVQAEAASNVAAKNAKEAQQRLDALAYEKNRKESLHKFLGTPTTTEEE